MIVCTVLLGIFASCKSKSPDPPQPPTPPIPNKDCTSEFNRINDKTYSSTEYAIDEFSEFIDYFTESGCDNYSTAKNILKEFNQMDLFFKEQENNTDFSDYLREVGRKSTIFSNSQYTVIKRSWEKILSYEKDKHQHLALNAIDESTFISYILDDVRRLATEKYGGPLNWEVSSIDILDVSEPTMVAGKAAKECEARVRIHLVGLPLRIKKDVKDWKIVARLGFTEDGELLYMTYEYHDN